MIINVILKAQCKVIKLKATKKTFKIYILYQICSNFSQVKIQRVHIDGLTRTKDDIVARQVEDLFAASTFKDMIQLTADAKHKLERLGVFSSVGVFIDTSKGLFCLFVCL